MFHETGFKCKFNSKFILNPARKCPNLSIPKIQTLSLILLYQLIRWQAAQWSVTGLANIPLGQRILPEGMAPPRQQIRNIIGGFYSQNVTLFFRNSPFRVQSELIVESGSTLTIETGVQMYFDTGVGVKVFGTIHAIGNEFAHIQMLPYQEQLNYDDVFPTFRLIDGPSVRQGRLQVRFRDRWRSVCTQLTNWTSVDTGVACRSIGYSSGGFWRYYRRNNDTYPFVMPVPNCRESVDNLWKCNGFSDPNLIPLTENLCQGEDDMGLYCWGQPTFNGWSKHWKGIQIFNSPYQYVEADPDKVATQRESFSRLEFVDILYAGYDGLTRNTTAALYVEGVPPIMNGLRVERSARDGIYFYESQGPILIANSTIAGNRGHGIAVDNTIDARCFVNQSIVQENYGDGIWYRQLNAGLSNVQAHYGTEIFWRDDKISTRSKRHNEFVDLERPRLDMCVQHQVPNNFFFPHLVKAHLQNGTVIDPLLLPQICWLIVSLPARLRYSYTLQFINVQNRNPTRAESLTELIICDANSTFAHLCQVERYRIPINDRVLPQSVTIPNAEKSLFIGIQHSIGNASNGATIHGDIDLLFKIHATITDKAFYGLNITNSVILNNMGNGIRVENIRERTALCNVSVNGNEGLAGLLVHDGAADIWLNDTSLSYNWGDGINISYAGGSINVNGSRIVDNRWRGFAYHHNASIPYWALRHELIVKGRPANNVFYPKTLISGNLWGGLLIGNLCIPTGFNMESKIHINWVEFANNAYHPAIELFSCQDSGIATTRVDISGNSVLYGSAMGLRVEPCVNMDLTINSNRFHNIQNSAMLIRNARHPQLTHLPAQVRIYKNDIKMNTGPQFIVSIGLNEDALDQRLEFAQQNELRMNTIINPFPLLKARSTPHAALVVSSSNPNSDYEIATELAQHAKRIDARQNNWGDANAHNFMHRIFDQFNRYSLAQIDINPFSAVCNQRSPAPTLLQQYYRPFRQQAANLFVIGGTIYENQDLQAGTYTVVEDLHVTPGAKLTLASGTRLEFMNGVGMLIQGELLRSDYLSPLVPVIFTSAPFHLPKLENIRLVDELGNEDVMAGRLEIRLADGQWGTVCNRSWTVSLAQLACNQLGLTMDPQYYENWRIFPLAGDLPIRMDNIRCEEHEYDITRCRHDGILHNAQSPLSCRPSEVVGIRCAEPRWAGVRYSLLASPPTTTGQVTMHNWIIEKAGLFDFRNSIFSAALQIDWNYHVFNGLTVRDNFYNGVDIIYNDLTKKPAIRHSYFTRNRRNGLVLRSNGITIENIVIEGNANAGIHYNSRVDVDLQRDIASWLDGREQPDLEANNIHGIPPENRRIRHSDSLYPAAFAGTDSAVLNLALANRNIRPAFYGYNYAPGRSGHLNNYPKMNTIVDEAPAFLNDDDTLLGFGSVNEELIQVFESQLHHRMFLVAKPTRKCPMVLTRPCVYEFTLQAVGHQFGLEPKLAIQIVNRWHNQSDEDIEFFTGPSLKFAPTWSVRRNTIEFPIISSSATLKARYSRSIGRPAIILLVLFLDAQEYLDRFVHIHNSAIRRNQYAISAIHYSNLTSTQDGAVLARNANEKLWFQKVNFTQNIDAVLWMHSPQHEVLSGTPIAKIAYHIDNCSVTENFGPIVDMHRDLFSSANVFSWNFWSNTFANNSNSGIVVQMPDTYDLLAQQEHRFLMTENRFESNHNFSIHLHGYYAFANISSNNFTDNFAPHFFGILQLSGMEKHLILERNRFFGNWGSWMVRIDTTSQSLRRYNMELEIPAFIQYNYFQFNHFINRLEDYVDMWPRSYAVGVFGTQKVDVHFNRFRNVLMDFELVAGCNPQLPGVEAMNVSYNWWGVANDAEVSQRIFDLDDWNIYTLANFSPYYTTEELFINFWWHSKKGQLSYANYTEPSSLDLKGRMFKAKTLTLDAERWYPFPYHYRPFRPYRITRDLTIMPGATLTIERNVEVHVWPNVRILVLGDLVADGTLWQPIRFRPINVTEYAQQLGRIPSQFRRKRGIISALKQLHNDNGEDSDRWSNDEEDPEAVEEIGLEERALWARRSGAKGRADTLWWRRYRRRERRHAIDARFFAFVRQRRAVKENILMNVDLFRQFPEMRRENPFLQEFSVWLSENGTMRGRSGFLSYYNRTTGEFIPSCDRYFTLRNAQVVCRELGFEPTNVYHWLTPRWDYNPLVKILKTYVEPRECRGDELRLERCAYRISGEPANWQCVDAQHFNYIHCGKSRALSHEYYGHWGGITFAPVSLDYAERIAEDAKDRSILRHVEIVGGGVAHNDPIQSAALQIVARSPQLENVNVTNSAMHGIQIAIPTNNPLVNRVNVSHNHGLGINIVTANLHAQGKANAGIPQGALNLPYALPGLLNVCASGKTIYVKSRILLYYKYDSLAVDCVKIFFLQNEISDELNGNNRQTMSGSSSNSAGTRTLAFRFLQFNLFEGVLNVGRSDALSLYSGTDFAPARLLHRFDAFSAFRRINKASSMVIVPAGAGPVVMGLHLRATASDGQYGFLAEISVLPAKSAPKYVEEVTVRDSRIMKNDRGAITYRNVGEIGPTVVMELCSVQDNGYFLYGNVSSSSQAIELYLHNTILFLFRSNTVRGNQGGMLVLARSSSSVTNLQVVVKSSAFIGNSNSTILAFVGNDDQKITLINNIIAHNHAVFFDTVLLNRVSTNFSHNLFYGNVGLHLIDTHSAYIMALHHPSNPTTSAATLFGPSFAGDTVYSNEWALRSDLAGGGPSTSTHLYYQNYFDDNLALGHEFQYNEAFGYTPPDAQGEHGLYDEFRRRPRHKRQVLSQRGTSFDWWTHVDSQTSRYRSTILAGSSPQQRFFSNIFNNPRNSYELTTSVQTEYDSAAVDARENYWGYPSTAGVAAGKIRDYSDYPKLVRVEYLPVLESNTSLIEGDCSAGWFQVGKEEFKSCLLFVGASMSYADAVATCEQMGAFMPILRTEDARQREIAARVDAFAQRYVVDAERYNSFPVSYDVPIWMSSVTLPSHQCGWMSSRTASIGEQNCNNLLPFVCEKGTKPYQEPIMWRRDILIAISAFVVLFILIMFLAFLALCKSQRRRDNFAKRKAFVRESLRRKSLTTEKLKNGGGGNLATTVNGVGTANQPNMNATNFNKKSISDESETCETTAYESGSSYMFTTSTISTSSTSSDYGGTTKCGSKRVNGCLMQYNKTSGVSMDPYPQPHSLNSKRKLLNGVDRQASGQNSILNSSGEYSFCASSSASTAAYSSTNAKCMCVGVESSLNTSDATYCSCVYSTRSSSTATSVTVLAGDDAITPRLSKYDDSATLMGYEVWNELLARDISEAELRDRTMSPRNPPTSTGLAGTFRKIGSIREERQKQRSKALLAILATESRQRINTLISSPNTAVTRLDASPQSSFCRRQSLERNGTDVSSVLSKSPLPIPNEKPDELIYVNFDICQQNIRNGSRKKQSETGENGLIASKETCM